MELGFSPDFYATFRNTEGFKIEQFKVKIQVQDNYVTESFLVQNGITLNLLYVLNENFILIADNLKQNKQW